MTWRRAAILGWTLGAIALVDVLRSRGRIVYR